MIFNEFGGFPSNHGLKPFEFKLAPGYTEETKTVFKLLVDDNTGKVMKTLHDKGIGSYKVEDGNFICLEVHLSEAGLMGVVNKLEDISQWIDSKNIAGTFPNSLIIASVISVDAVCLSLENLSDGFLDTGFVKVARVRYETASTHPKSRVLERYESIANHLLKTGNTAFKFSDESIPKLVEDLRIWDSITGGSVVTPTIYNK